MTYAPSPAAGHRTDVRRGPVLRALLLALAVGLAFADSSVVVLAVPDLLAELDEPLPDVAQVVTAYNLALAVGAVAAVPLLRSGRAPALTRVGLVVFTVAGAACAAAPDLPALVAARAAQGAGAALLLAGALPVLAALLPGAGLRAWTLAGAAGAAVGPALGGALTQAYDWRAVFVVQAPVGAAALLAVLRPAAPAPPAASEGAVGGVAAGEPVAGGPGRHPLRVGAAHVGLVLVSGGLVGALFLVVVLLVDGLGLDPLAAAGVASAVPLAAAVTGPLAPRLAAAPAAAAGALLLAAGLTGLALLPAASLLLVAGWLAACGAGLGLAVPPLVEAVVRGGTPERLGRAGSWSTASRHLGLTLALLVVPTVLAEDLGDSVERAVARGTAQVLDVQVPLGTKVDLAQTLADDVLATPAGELPDLAPAFAAAARDDPDAVAELRALEAGLEETVRSSVVRGFRGALLVTAGLAAAAVLPALLLGAGGRRPGAARGPLAVALGAIAVTAALLAAQVGVGGTAYGAGPARDPCAGGPAYPGEELDDRLQRVVLVALDEAACDLGTSREVVLSTLVPDRGQQRLPVPQEELDRAVRDGLLAGLDAEQDRGLNRFVAGALREVVRRADLRDLVDQLTGD